MEKNIYDIVGVMVRERRNGLGWSQEELGERAGLHPSYIGQIERGVKKVSLATIEKLAHALSARVSDLMREEITETRQTPWTNKIIGCLRDMPDTEQQRAYRIIKETFRRYHKT